MKHQDIIVTGDDKLVVVDYETPGTPIFEGGAEVFVNGQLIGFTDDGPEAEL